MTNESYPESQQAATKSLGLRGHRPQEFRGQRGRILSLLLRHKGEWVETFRLAQIALQYCSRLKECRDRGYVIENKTARIDGQVHGWFRLVREPGDSEAADPSPSEGEHLCSRANQFHGGPRR